MRPLSSGQQPLTDHVLGIKNSHLQINMGTLTAMNRAFPLFTAMLFIRRVLEILEVLETQKTHSVLGVTSMVSFCETGEALGRPFKVPKCLSFSSFLAHWEEDLRFAKPS